MPAQQPTPERRVDADGVTRVDERRAGAGTWVLVGAVVVTLACLVLGVWLALSPLEAPAEEQRGTGDERRTPTVRRVKVAAPRKGATVQERVAQEAAAQGVPVEVIAEAMRDAGPPPERSGLALFPAMGTQPLMEGLIVPESYELPPGYVRHYQVTDEGQMLPAILMFHPDYTPKDEQGKPLPVPEDRVVPWDMAPPGMPLELLEVGEPEP
jgi:hypothetical protein